MGCVISHCKKWSWDALSWIISSRCVLFRMHTNIWFCNQKWILAATKRYTRYDGNIPFAPVMTIFLPVTFLISDSFLNKIREISSLMMGFDVTLTIFINSFYQVFHFASPFCHNHSRVFRFWSVSIAYQKPLCLYAISSPSVAIFSSGVFSKGISSQGI